MSTRNVRTVYFNEKFEAVKVNYASDPNKACVRAFEHLQYNDYGNKGAKSAQVFDSGTARLYADFVRDMATSSIHTIYKEGDPATMYQRKPRRAAAAFMDLKIKSKKEKERA